jgi:hypothetical protein
MFIYRKHVHFQDVVCDASKKCQQDSQWAIGIDFGTSYCCVAINKNGKIQLATDDEGNIKIPSAVAIVPHGTSLKKRIGYDALQYKDNPENFITGNGHFDEIFIYIAVEAEKNVMQSVVVPERRNYN